MVYCWIATFISRTVGGGVRPHSFRPLAQPTRRLIYFPPRDTSPAQFVPIISTISCNACFDSGKEINIQS